MTWTKLAIITKVELDLDLQEESIITPSEMTGYLNDSIRDARALILSLDEDYFLTDDFLELVDGDSEVALPADIFASKIRGIVYDDGTRRYEIKRIRNFKKFLKIHVLNAEPAADPLYRYYVKDQASLTGPKIVFVPPSQEDSDENVTIWYLRDAAELTIDADVCDIPEYINYIFAHMKKSCLAKMNDGIAPPEAVRELDTERDRLVEGLTTMTPDNDDEIEQDLSHYEDHN